MAPNELEAYIKNERYKDGLARCNKLLKKSPNDNLLLIYKARLLHGLSLISLANVDAVTEILDQLCNKRPAITDVAHLLSLEDLAFERQLQSWPPSLTNGPQMAQLWSNAASEVSKKQAVELHRARYENAVKFRQWRDAGTALLGLKKSNPNDSNLRFQHIAVQQILADTESDERQAMLNRTLAFRTIQQIARASAAQTNLMFDVLLRQGRADQVLSMLDIDRPLTSPEQQLDNFTPGLRISEWEYAKHKTAALTATKQWAKLREHSVLLLDTGGEDKLTEALKSQARGEWVIWLGYLQASEALKQWEDATELVKFRPEDNFRIAFLITLWIAYAFDAHAQSILTHDTGHSKYETTLAALKQVIDYRQSYLTCFGDIKDWVMRLPPAELLEFRQYIAKSPMDLLAKGGGETEFQFMQWINAETTALQFEYHICIGSVKHPSADYTEAFICNAIRLHKLGMVYSQNTTILCVAVFAMVRLHELRPESAVLQQAVTMLMHVVEEGHGDYEAKVLLVYILGELGNYGAAVYWYNDLSIKEMQHETMGHSLMTRLSISHPFSISRWNPLDLMAKALGMYAITDDKLYTTQVNALDLGRSDLLLELEDMRKALAHSMTKRILVLEQRRVARLTNLPSEKCAQVHRQDIRSWVYNLKDSRDFNTVVNHEGSKEYTIERRLHQRGELPTGYWIVCALLSDSTWSLLLGEPTILDCDFGDIVPNAFFDLPEERTGLTECEDLLRQHWQQLYEATCQMSPRNEFNDHAAFATAFVDHIKHMTWLLEGLKGDIDKLIAEDYAPWQTPSGCALQSYFLLLDFLRAMWLFCSFAVDTGKLRKVDQKAVQSAIAILRPLVKSLFESLQTHARRQRGRISVREIEKWLRQDKIGKALNDDRYFDLGAHAVNMHSAALDAWDGVLKVKLAHK